jgi:hypothetical protein
VRVEVIGKSSFTPKMDIPEFRKGLELNSRELNRLSNAVRSASVTSVIGGRFTRTPGGTTIVVDQQAATGGAAKPCPFQVSDVSEPKEGGGLNIKIEISQNPILGTKDATYPDGRYPDGMSGEPNAPAYKIDLNNDVEVLYIYVNIQVDQLAEILPASTAITISVDKEFTQGNSTYQKTLIAIVEKRLDTDGKAYISSIQNLCPVAFARPAPPCPFLVEDDSRDGFARVSIRSGLVNNALPDNMNLTDTFTLTLSTSENFWVIYCGMVVINGVIQTGPGMVTIFAADSYQVDTPTYVYFKLAELTIASRDNGTTYVSWVLNSCAIPFVSGGGNVKCFFQCTNASEDTDLKVKVAQDQISNRWPDGMGLGFPDFILEISQSCYIYAKVVFNTTTLLIETASNSITILQSNDLQANTASEQYILLATVLTGTGPVKITQINNICSQPVPNPCALAWST